MINVRSYSYSLVVLFFLFELWILPASAYDRSTRFRQESLRRSSAVSQKDFRKPTFPSGQKLILQGESFRSQRTPEKVRGMSLTSRRGKIKIAPGQTISSLQVWASVEGRLFVSNSNQANQRRVFSLDGNRSYTLPTEWTYSSKTLKIAWRPLRSRRFRGLIITSIGLLNQIDQSDISPPFAAPIPTANITQLPEDRSTPTAIITQPGSLNPDTVATIFAPRSDAIASPSPTAAPTKIAAFTPTVPAEIAEDGINNSDCPGFAIDGYGKGTTGGCGGATYYVTSLADPIAATPGTFRYLIEKIKGPRIIKFAVSGTIKLRKNVKIITSDVTIDAGSAPDGGVQFSGATLIVSASNVIIRYLRFLIGPDAPVPSSADNIRIAGDSGSWVEHVVLDHCSLGWATDENLSIVNKVRFVTVQWSIVAEGLYRSTHSKAAHSMGALLSYETTHITFHHNLFAHNNYRNPQLANNGVIEWTNNVVYNSGTAAGVLQTPLSGGENWLDAIGNYTKGGPESDWVEASRRYSWRHGVVKGISHTYLKGNIDWNRTSDNQAEDIVVSSLLRRWVSLRPFVTDQPVPATSAGQAYQDVLNGAGAILPCRSSFERRIVDDTHNGTGNFVNHPEERGGWPDLSLGCQ